MSFFLVLVMNGSSWAGEGNMKQVGAGLLIFLGACAAIGLMIGGLKPRVQNLKSDEEKYKYSVLPDGEKWRIEK